MSSALTAWTKADTYDAYVGRWSRAAASEFLSWLEPAQRGTWVDVGCGTGALIGTIVERAAPRVVIGVDASPEYMDGARRAARGGRVVFALADAFALPLRDASADCAVSGLVLNFAVEPRTMVAEMARVVRSGGTVALYVWDYADRMELMRFLWDTAVQLDPAASDRDEGRRFSICAPDPLFLAFARAGLRDVEVVPIDVPTVFRDFEDYWTPFLGGQGPAGAYVMSLDERARTRLREHLRGALPHQTDGSIALVARAWAVKGTA